MRTSLSVPAYDQSALRTGIVHIGPGAFHRSHQAMYVDRLLEAGSSEWGICGMGLLPSDRRVRNALLAQSGQYTLVLKHPDGSLDARVIGALHECLLLADDPWVAVERLANPSTRIVSMTITEGGYNVSDESGLFDSSTPSVLADLVPGSPPRTVFGLLAHALRRRKDAGAPPFTVMSCDNIELNGAVTRNSLAAFGDLWQPGFGSWVRDQVAFPSSMVDRITPATTDTDRELVRTHFGVDDDIPVMAEPYVQWVLEDTFPTGRPDLEKVGVQLVGDVRPYELMKLRLLNVGHQAIAYFASLMGYAHVHEAIADPLLEGLLRGYFAEATPTLEPVPGVNLVAYQDMLVGRFANPAVADTVARLCAFSSDRIPKWLVPVVRHNRRNGGSTRTAAAIVASWARYTEGVDDEGQPIDVVDRRCATLPPSEELLGDRELFGDLGADPGFAAQVSHALGRLHAVGARQTLVELLAP